jgi:hypothetical protein
VLYVARDLAGLAELLLLPRERLHSATVHRFAASFQPQGRLLQDESLSFMRNDDLRRCALYPGARFCPICLRDGLYHRVHWDLLPVTMCLVHSVILRDRCSACGRKISHQQVVTGRDLCGHDLRNTKTVPAPGGSAAVAAQAHIASLLGMDAQLCLSFTGPAFALPAWSFFSLLDIIEHIIMGAANRLRPHKVEDLETDSFLSRTTWRQEISVRDHHTLVLAAFRVLTDWPQNFFAFLDEYRARDRDTICGRPSRRYQPFQTLGACRRIPF